MTVIDYYSRYLLACYFTPSSSADQITKAVDLARAEAERLHGPLERQPFLVTDNGSSFLGKWDVYHVRIQYRTPTQLGSLERFHHTLKTEEVYWKLYEGPGDARRSPEEFRIRYNEVRPHWALRPAGGGDPRTPEEVYAGGLSVELPKWQSWALAAKEKLERMAGEARLPLAATRELEPVSLSR